MTKTDPDQIRQQELILMSAEELAGIKKKYKKLHKKLKKLIIKINRKSK